MPNPRQSDGGGQAHGKSALNHGVAGSQEGGELYTSVSNQQPHEFPNVRFLLSVGKRGAISRGCWPRSRVRGRSNSGKSSAINTILVRNGLARASKTPGRTRLLNFFEIEPGRRIIDLPGYGYAMRRPVESKQWTALIDALPHARASSRACS